MPKVYCAEIECEYYSEKGCKAKEINVSAGHIHTIHQGFARHWVCKTFKKSKEAEEISELLQPFLDKIKKEEKPNSSVKIPVISMEDVPKIMEEMEK